MMKYKQKREDRERKSNSGDYEREEREKIVQGMREKINYKIYEKGR